MDLTPGVHFWRLWGIAGSRVGTSHGPTWIFGAPSEGRPVDTVSGFIDDVDGDGVADAWTTSGAVTSLTLSASGRRWSNHALHISILRPTTEIHDYYARPGSPTDLDGDGYGDLIGVATYHYQGAGYYYEYTAARFMGGPDGPTSVWWSRLGDVMSEGRSGSWTYLTIDRAGDIDGDGRADIVAYTNNREYYTAFTMLASDEHRAIERGRGFIHSARDFDGDGLSDALVSIGHGCPCSPSLQGISSRAGVVTVTPLPRCETFDLGSLMSASFSDLDRDGLGDVRVTHYGGPITSPTDRVYRGNPAGFGAARCEPSF